MPGHVLLVEQHLPLQVGEIDKIPIDNPQQANSRPNERVGQHSPQRTAPAQQHPRRANRLLSFNANAGKPHLAAVAFE